MIYIGNPYTSDDPSLIRRRAKRIIDLTAEVYSFYPDIQIVPFSPIALTDQFAYLKSLTEEMWRELVMQYLIRCDAMIVVMFPGWQDSVGLKMEIDYCKKHKVPVMYCFPDDLLLTCRKLSLVISQAAENENEGG